MRRACRALIALGLAGGVLSATTACSGSSSPAPSATRAAETPASSSPSPSPDATDVPAASPRPLNCETLIPSDTVAALQPFTRRRFPRCRLVVETSLQLSAWEVAPPDDPALHHQLSGRALAALSQPI